MPWRHLLNTRLLDLADWVQNPTNQRRGAGSRFLIDRWAHHMFQTSSIFLSYIIYIKFGLLLYYLTLFYIRKKRLGEAHMTRKINISQSDKSLKTQQPISAYVERAYHLGHVQAHTGAQRFATVSGLNDMFPGNGAQRGLRYVLSCFAGVSKMPAQSAATCI